MKNSKNPSFFPKFLLFITILAALFSINAAAASTDTVRVGLYYGTSALPTANLQNEVGSGYSFGYFDSDRNFVAFGTTSETKLTMASDENLYFSSGAYYETKTASASTLVGAYHVQLPGTYASFTDAQTAAGKAGGFPAWTGGTFVVRCGSYASLSAATTAAAAVSGATAVGASADCVAVLATETAEILFEFDGGGTAYLGIQPISSGAGAQTWFKGFDYYGAFQYRRFSGGNLTVVNFVNIDDYVDGVVPYEMYASWPLETLKAGAVAARTFALRATKHASYGFDVCNTTDCQVYHGVYTDDNAANVRSAVDETAGECLYSGGALIEALYFAADGGATEDAENAWGGAYAYLKGKTDPYEASVETPYENWSYTFTAAELTALLQARGVSCGTIVSLSVTGLTANGNVNELTLTDSAGKTYTLKNDAVRSFFKSSSKVSSISRRFTITASGAESSGGTFSVYDGTGITQRSSLSVLTGSGTTTVSGSASCITSSGVTTAGGSSATQAATGWTVSGSGNGHNVGMSQWGAYAMGKQGLTYRDILTFYYTGVTIQ